MGEEVLPACDSPGPKIANKETRGHGGLPGYTGGNAATVSTALVESDVRRAGFWWVLCYLHPEGLLNMI